MKRGGPIARRTPMPRGGPVKARNPKRRAANHARAYGPDERIAFVKGLRCVVLACARQPIEVAHVVTGGMGRKGDASLTVPLCTVHHREQHQVGVRTFQQLHGLDLLALAEQTEAAWQAHVAALRAQPGRQP